MKMLRNISQGVEILAVAMLLGASSNLLASAQQITPVTAIHREVTITIQVLDGNSGKPITANSIFVECFSGGNGCGGFRGVYDADPTGNGQLQIKVPSSATALSVYSSGDQYDYCSAHTFRLSDLETTGVLDKNDCKTLTAKQLAAWIPQPGRLVVFTHRKPWWIRMLPYC